MNLVWRKVEVIFFDKYGQTIITFVFKNNLYCWSRNIVEVLILKSGNTFLFVFRTFKK